MGFKTESNKRLVFAFKWELKSSGKKTTFIFFNYKTMRKYILSAVASVVSGIAFGQITLHSTDFPNAGDSVLTSLANDIGTADQTLTGANYNWDFSFLTPSLQRYEKFDSPFTFTTPFNILFSVLNTTYGRDNYTITSIPVPGITFDAAYDFYKKSSGSLRQNGAGYTISGIPLPFLYNNADTVYRFPIDYLNTDSCNYKFALPTIGVLPFYYGQTGHRVNVVDGWGTITTPYGTFSALRLKSTISAIDTVYIDTLGFGFNIPRPLAIEYKWLAAGMKVPVLQINTSVFGATETITQVTYIDSVRSSVPQVGIAENTNNTNLIVYPNPAQNDLHVQYSLAVASLVKVSLTNVLGQMVVSMAVNSAAGKTDLTVDTRGLQAGIYFVNLEGSNFFEVKKIVVEK